MTVKSDLGPSDILDMADREGVAVVTVKDGYVLVFTKNQLELFLEQIAAKGSDKCMVFVKHRTFAN